MHKVGLLMKKMLLILVLFTLLNNNLFAEYISKEMFVLSWGWDSDQELPYAVENDGAVFGPYMRKVDREGNIYIAFPYTDFRKYNSKGEIVYRKDIKINQFAVDDSQNVYFTKLDPDQLHIVRVLDRNGSTLENQYPFIIRQDGQNISWMKNRDGQVVFGNYRETAKLNETGITTIVKQKKNPLDSKGYYYQSETAMRKSNRTSKTSFRQEYMNILIDKVVNNEIVRLDTISFRICRYPQQAAEVIEVDSNDNLFIWLYYNDDLPIDFVVLDSTYKEIDRIELVPISESKGLWLRPYVLPDGTIYEFRDLEDGLHVIRWAKEE